MTLVTQCCVCQVGTKNASLNDKSVPANRVENYEPLPLSPSRRKKVSLKRIPGWDVRDYELWSELQSLPSYGLLSNDDRMISRRAVEKLLEAAAKTRYSKESQC
jgi:hypothetical protein